jgi:hypothetical protein
MLKLLDGERARVFGLPPRDLDEDDALKLLAHLGAGAPAHLDDAIAAGAFSRADAKVTKAKPRGQIDLSDGVDGAEATLAAQALNARKNQGG